MVNKYCLVIAKDYWGTLMAVETGKKIYDFFISYELINGEHSTFVIGDSVSCSSVISSYKDNIQRLKEPNTILYVVMIGHGNQISDINSDELDGKDEIYQLPDGNITDDLLTNIIDEDIMDSTSLLVLISDHCSSGTMLDRHLISKSNWVNIASSLDYEDSYSSGEGNVMINCLLSVLDKEKDNIHELTILDIKNKLDIEMKESFIGELQHSCVSVSDDTIWDRKFIPI
jgi:hypothetical protein